MHPPVQRHDVRVTAAPPLTDLQTMQLILDTLRPSSDTGYVDPCIVSINLYIIINKSQRD